MLRTPNEGFTFQNSPPVSTGDFMTKVIQGTDETPIKRIRPACYRSTYAQLILETTVLQ